MADRDGLGIVGVDLPQNKRGEVAFRRSSII